MAESKINHTEAELKRLPKSELQKIATDLNIEGADDLNVPKLIEGILSAQSDADEGIIDEVDEAAKASTSDPEVKSDPTPAPKKSDLEMIEVRAVNRTPGKDGGFKRAFWERNPDHPEGEVWIGDDQTYTVARTEAVNKAIMIDKTLEVVSK